MKKLLLIFLSLLPTVLLAQPGSYYFHTINTNSLAFTVGRTFKGTYAHQLSRFRQLKISGIYVADEYEQDANRIRADVFNAGLQFQYNVLNIKKIFLSANLGLGANYLQAIDLIDIKHEKLSLSFIGGFQGEYYFDQNRWALLLDYDILYLPFSGLYEFLHIPTIGLGIFF
ncbi:MAG: hypothetical protein ONA90_05535 [candidate division KSB1 bacterium]|nr:hypothetical protein [candidate division KSB1 bacterium]